jgi:signal transduction histidine kinase
MAITRKLVELHGGGISAASEGLGRGATFTVRLPALEGPRRPLRRELTV